MKASERLKEIEECVSTRSGDIEWLINRVKKLTEGLEIIAAATSLFDTALEEKCKKFLDDE